MKTETSSHSSSESANQHTERETRSRRSLWSRIEAILDLARIDSWPFYSNVVSQRSMVGWSRLTVRRRSSIPARRSSMSRRRRCSSAVRSSCGSRAGCVGSLSAARPGSAVLRWYGLSDYVRGGSWRPVSSSLRRAMAGWSIHSRVMDWASRSTAVWFSSVTT